MSAICCLPSTPPPPQPIPCLPSSDHTADFHVRNKASCPSSASSQLSTVRVKLGEPIATSSLVMCCAAALKLSALLLLPSPKTASGILEAAAACLLLPLFSHKAVKNLSAFVGISPVP